MPPLRPPTVLAGAALVTAGLLGAGTMVLLDGDETAAPTAARSPSPSPSPSPSASPSPAPSPSASPSPSPVVQLDQDDLDRAQVPALCGQPAGRLRDGVLGRVELTSSAFVDLDGDGVFEGVALLSCRAGGTASAHVYKTGPRLVGQVPIETGIATPVTVTALKAVRDRVEVSGRFAAQDDPPCCPGGFVVRSYRLVDAAVVQIAAPALDRSIRVSGDGWGTVKVGLTYEQLARATGLPVFVDLLDDVPGQGVEEASCSYVHARGLQTEGVAMVGGEGKVRAVTFSKPGVLSKSGVGVGSTEREVLAAYGPRAKRVGNEYGPVQDVVVDAGPGRIVRFEFDDERRRVDTMHAGETEYASLPEGCA